MLDIKFVRANPDAVKENIRKKFQDEKIPMVDEVIAMDEELRAAKTRGDELRANRNSVSKQIGQLMKAGKKDEAEEAKKQVTEMADELAALEKKEEELAAEINQRMMVIPQMIDDSVPIGKDDSENVELERFGEPVVPEWEIPYHIDIMEMFSGVDLDSARRTSGNGFYYLKGDIARLHSSILSYARDFMINKGFEYFIPPFMIHGDVVKGVMSFKEMENMMYKIEGEDLYLIGTSEHSMVGRYIGQMLDKDQLPQALTSYSPCFRKEVGAHGIEERGVYRIHQFEKQEMVVICEPEDSPMWFNKLWNNTVEFFRSLDIPGSLVPAPAEVLRSRQLLQPGRRAGQKTADPCPRQGKRQLFRTHPEQYRRRASQNADRIPGEPLQTRWNGHHPRSAAALHGRPEGADRKEIR